MFVIEKKPVKILIAVLVLALTAVTIKCMPNTGLESGSFVAADTPKVETYVMDDEGQLQQKGDIARGTEVTVTGRSATVEGDAKADPADAKADLNLVMVKTGDREVYISEENLTEDADGIVREEKVYVRTPATVYEKENGPDISGFAPKGTELKVAGYDKLDSDGIVNRYKVESDGISGWVYGKYMVESQERADAPFNENGEYDKAKTAKYGIELYGGKATDLDYYPVDKPEIKGNKFCRHARTMYLNWYAAVHNDEYLKLVKKSGCNAVVMDIKDGVLAYRSEVAKELSPSSYKHGQVSMDEYREAVKKFNDAGIYTIGRIVCFNDKDYGKDHPEDCINSEGWPSAFCRNVWEYNVKLAIEAVGEMGFNEIQFDYVRFPEASYELSQSGADFKNKYGEEKNQAVQNFCFYAADQIHEAGAYFSVDVFGECSNGYPTAYGQYWPAISNVVDAISSMPYTDHFGTSDTWTEPKGVMMIWAGNAAKAQKMIPTPAAARTWITGYDTPHWSPVVDYNEEKLQQQIDALDENGLDGGFIPWNAASAIDKYRQYQGIWADKQ